MHKVQVVAISSHTARKVLLLQTNSKRGGFWQNITGSVEHRESFLEAALRELEEETGLLTQVQKMIPLGTPFQFHHHKRDIHYKEQPFLALLSGSNHPRLDPREHQRSQWLSLAQITPQHYGYNSNFEIYEKAVAILSAHSL